VKLWRLIKVLNMKWISLPLKKKKKFKQRTPSPSPPLSQVQKKRFQMCKCWKQVFIKYMKELKNRSWSLTKHQNIRKFFRRLELLHLAPQGCSDVLLLSTPHSSLIFQQKKWWSWENSPILSYKLCNKKSRFFLLSKLLVLEIRWLIAWLFL